MSSPRAATSVETRIWDWDWGEGEEKRSIERRRAFCGIWECKELGARERFWRKEESRRTEVMELVKIRVRAGRWWRRRV